MSILAKLFPYLEGATFAIEYNKLIDEEMEPAADCLN